MKIYSTIHKLPLSIFIDVMVNKDLKLLVIEGECDEITLAETWQNITNEYIDAIASKEVRIKLELNNKIVFKETVITLVDNLFQLIDKKPCEQLFNSLYLFNYPLPKLEYSEENLNKLLSSFIMYYNKEKFEYRVLVKKYEDSISQKTEAIVMDYKYFNKVIVEIKMHLGASIIPNEVTTGVFCEYVGRLTELIEQKRKIK